MSGGRPVLLCFDGSPGAVEAIAVAGRELAGRDAIVLTVWEPVAIWEPYDPGAILSAAIAKLGSRALGLDEIARDLAAEKLDRGVELATAAGFRTERHLGRGKTWRTICLAAVELDARVIVLGARGLSRAESAILGSVSAAVVTHARCPVLVIHSTSREPPDSMPGECPSPDSDRASGRASR